MKRLYPLMILAAAVAAPCPGADTAGALKLRPVPFTKVTIEDAFWAPRIETNRTVTIPYDFKKCAETGRLANFARAGGLEKGGFQGIFFNDSDVYKVVEGAAYSLSVHPDPQLERYLDDLIATFAAAQRDDGYLFTYQILNGPEKYQRWSNLGRMHELYCAGHLFEGAVAHYRATGKKSFLNVAVKLADLIDAVFGPGRKTGVPGHQEIEIGLVKLSAVTGDRKYLDLAKFFLDRRGGGRAYSQNHEPVTEQSAAVGHAVRAAYMYTGMADVAARTGDRAYVEAIDRIWRNVVGKKLYITGGIGARHGGEAFGDDYELPNASAYNETCAAIANIFWNHRMNLLHGCATYADVLELTLYNGFLSGISLSGDRFFYPNPLAADGRKKFNHGAATRQPWFGCSCCPVNIVRVFPQISGWVYAVDPAGVYVNLYAAGTGRVAAAGTAVELTQETRYPWEGAVTLAVKPAKPAAFALCLRIPGWVRGTPVPSDLYRVAKNDGAGTAVEIKVNGAAVEPEIRAGYARIERRWKAGDTVSLSLPMPVRRVRCHEAVAANRGKVALMRGPLVYCLEGTDHPHNVLHYWLPPDAALEPAHRADLLGGVTVLTGEAKVRLAGADEPQAVAVTAIPYYAWSNRGVTSMAVWLPAAAAGARPVPRPTIASRSKASASFCHRNDSPAALNDQVEPKNSIDHAIARLTWWDHRGTTEWVQYDFAEPATVTGVSVYWFDDTGRGRCRVPASWRVLYRSGEEWKPVTGAGTYPAARDTFNTVTFDAVKTTALRIQVQLQEEFSGGILEWTVAGKRAPLK